MTRFGECGPRLKRLDCRQGICEDSDVLAFVTPFDQMLYDSVDGLLLGFIVGTEIPDWNREIAGCATRISDVDRSSTCSHCIFV